MSYPRLIRGFVKEPFLIDQFFPKRTEKQAIFYKNKGKRG